MEVGNMERNEPNEDAPAPRRRVTSRHKAVRYAVPVAVAGAAAAAIGFVPAFAGDDPELPKMTAEQLVAKIAESDTRTMSGTVEVRTDLGLPQIPEGLAGAAGGRGGSDVDPRARLTELASGEHTLRVAADGPAKQRLTIVEDAAEYSVIRNGGEVWAYDSGGDAAYHAKAPRDTDAKKRLGEQQMPGELGEVSPQSLAHKALEAVDETTSVKVDGTAKVAGRDAYQLLIKPRQAGSTVESVRIAVDAEKGVPLRFTLMPKSGGKAAIDARFTSVDYDRPAARTFEFTPPKGTEVTEHSEIAKKHGEDEAVQRALPGVEKPGAEKPGAGKPEAAEPRVGKSDFSLIGKGWTTVAELKAPEPGAAEKKADARDGDAGSEGMPPEAAKMLKGFGDEVTGDFGSGTLFSTRLVNVLMTEDGAVYAGAVDKGLLVKAANAAK
jgi:outer membrane lipoprotein-sorting protein